MRKKSSFLVLPVLILILVSGIYLRFESALGTTVTRPLMKDAGQYFMYAYNLRYKHTYSREVGNLKDPKSRVAPDALRSPGYPLFLALFVDGLPTKEIVNRVLFAQASISALTILIAFLFFQGFLSKPWSLAVAFLVALSPHLVVSNSYILTEALFCFLLLLLGLLVSRFAKKPSLWFCFSIGVVIGVASLVRSSLQFFPIVLACLLIFHYGWRKGIPFSGIVLLGFALAFSPWIARNMITLNRATDKRLMINFLHHGLYPNFTFDKTPESYSLPYRYDPRSEEIGQDIASVLKEIVRRFKQEPSRHAKWFLSNKPKAFWSWNIVQGLGDTFVYPVSGSPYFYDSFFKRTHWLIYYSHYPLVILALFGCLMVWFPLAKFNLSEEAVFTVRFCALLLIYYTLLHMIGAPFPRYSIPLRPFLYGMAFFTPYILFTSIQKRRSPRESFEQVRRRIIQQC